MQISGFNLGMTDAQANDNDSECGKLIRKIRGYKEWEILRVISSLLFFSTLSIFNRQAQESSCLCTRQHYLCKLFIK